MISDLRASPFTKSGAKRHKSPTRNAFPRSLSYGQCPICPFGAPSPRGEGYSYQAAKASPSFQFLIRAWLSFPIKGRHIPEAPPQSKKQTFHILHHDKKTYHQDRHKEAIEELPPERLLILLGRDLEAAMRAILQPHYIRHRAMAMRTFLAVPRRILRTLLRRQLRQDFHRRIQ